MNKIRSDFLFSTPSFVSGAARLLDWYCLYDSYNTSRSDFEADYKALFSDWYVVGQDISSAVCQFDNLLRSGQVAPSQIHSASLSHR
jgi:hypothetical protein